MMACVHDLQHLHLLIHEHDHSGREVEFVGLATQFYETHTAQLERLAKVMGKGASGLLPTVRHELISKVKCQLQFPGEPA